jgi:hypothetical protein
VSLDRQALCVMSKGPEMLSRATMAKSWLRPFARKVLPPFKEPPVPNVPRQPESLGSACESSRLKPTHGYAATSSPASPTLMGRTSTPSEAAEPCIAPS